MRLRKIYLNIPGWIVHRESAGSCYQENPQVVPLLPAAEIRDGLWARLFIVRKFFKKWEI